MDKSLPLDIVLHFDYVPYDERHEDGWTPQDVLEAVIEDMQRMIRTTITLALADYEIVESRKDTRP